MVPEVDYTLIGPIINNVSEEKMVAIIYHHVTFGHLCFIVNENV